MTSLDLFIVNVALNHIGQDIGQSSLSNLSWVLNGYAIFFASLLVPAGRLVDRYGRKAGFLTGMAVFTLAESGVRSKRKSVALGRFSLSPGYGGSYFDAE